MEEAGSVEDKRGKKMTSGGRVVAPVTPVTTGRGFELSVSGSWHHVAVDVTRCGYRVQKGSQKLGGGPGSTLIFILKQHKDPGGMIKDDATT